MLQQHNVSLLPYNTFGIDLPASDLITLSDTSLLSQLTRPDGKAPKIIGGGSNILLTRAVEDTVVLNRLKGRKILKENEQHVWVEVASGEIWHEFVLFALDNNWGGIENLALIPGTVGAAPIQNIGAYGVEVKDVIDSVHFFDWRTEKATSMTNEECRFGYRDSIFKQALKDQFFITSVVFRLHKAPHQLRLDYGAIREELQKDGIDQPGIKDVANAVIAIRTSKLPDPRQIGNAGSFFKNPTIGKDWYNTLREQFPTIPSYPVSNTTVKIPAGWLIEQCGWKGYREGDFGVHARQALVLVNYGHARGVDIWNLSGAIVHSVKDKFGIELEREVQIW